MSITPTLSLHDQADDMPVDAAMAVMRTAFPAQFGEAWTEPQLCGMLDLPGSWMLVARIGNDPAGFALVRMVLDEAELLLIAVHPDFRRLGIGRALMNRVLVELGESRAKSIHIEVREGNEAVLFYNHYGFEQIGRRPAYYRGVDGTSRDALTFQCKV